MGCTLVPLLLALPAARHLSVCHEYLDWCLSSQQLRLSRSETLHQLLSFVSRPRPTRVHGEVLQNDLASRSSTFCHASMVKQQLTIERTLPAHPSKGPQMAMILNGPPKSGRWTGEHRKMRSTKGSPPNESHQNHVHQRTAPNENSCQTFLLTWLSPPSLLPGRAKKPPRAGAWRGGRPDSGACTARLGPFLPLTHGAQRGSPTQNGGVFVPWQKENNSQ